MRYRAAPPPEFLFTAFNNAILSEIFNLKNTNLLFLKKYTIIYAILISPASFIKIINMPQLITIPKPCHEDWNTMTENNNGRHCNQCNKTVVDFTQHNPQQILFYLQQNASQKTCGRFNNTQIEEPLPTPEDFVKQISFYKISTIKKVAAIFIFAFSIIGIATSCNDGVANTNGKAISMVVDTPPVKLLIRDSIIPQPLLGAPIAVPVKDTFITKKITCTSISSHIMGDIAVPKIVDTIKQSSIIVGEPAMIQPVVEPDTSKASIIMGKIVAPKYKKDRN